MTAALAVGLLLVAGLNAGQRSAPSVTAEDRAGIEDLLGRYLIALGSCDAEKYASLFMLLRYLDGESAEVVARRRGLRSV